jgi:PTS system fructose-specific IIC component
MKHPPSSLSAELPPVELAGLLSADTVKLDLSCGSGDEVIDEMAALMEGAGVVTSAKRLAEALREREVLCSTGVGRGTAFLHPRRVLRDVVTRAAVGFGRCREGVDFHAVDGKPVKFFFIDCAPSERMHLSVLARLSRILVDDFVLKELEKADSPDELIGVLASAEDRLSSRGVSE